jgi:glycerophosphoryl diester phosphodiesterase
MPPWRWPRVLAHRCGGVLAPENSLDGLLASAAHGIAGVEFDAMLAACGTPVVIHDETLERTTEGAGAVAVTPWSDLGRLRLRDADGRLSKARIPSLDQVLDLCTTLGLAANVEIKPAAGHERDIGEQVARRVAGRVEARPLPVLLSSFSRLALTEAARAAPRLPRGLLVEQVNDDAIRAAHELGCASLIANTDDLSAEWVSRAGASGLTVAVYTENDPARAQERLRWGVTALISDTPHRLCLGSDSSALA